MLYTSYINSESLLNVFLNTVTKTLTGKTLKRVFIKNREVIYKNVFTSMDNYSQCASHTDGLSAGTEEDEGWSDISDRQRAVQLLRPTSTSTMRPSQHAQQLPAHQVRLQ